MHVFERCLAIWACLDLEYSLRDTGANTRVHCMGRLPPIFTARRMYAVNCFPGPTTTGSYPSDVYEQYRELFLRRPPLPVNRRRSIVYVSRKGGSNRSMRTIKNEGELLNRLEKEFSPDFEIIYFEGSKRRLNETIEIFEHARVVIGARKLRLNGNCSN
jgi:hypothetical protein